MSFEKSIQAVQRFAKNQVKYARQNLTKKRKNADKSLYNSLGYLVSGSFERGKVGIQFKMNDYGGFVDTGVKGTGKKPTGKFAKKLKMKTPLKSKFANELFKYNKQPAFKSSENMIPPSVLLPWIKARGIKGRNELGRFITNKSLSFAMAISIHRQGLTGTGVFSNPLKKHFDNFTKDLGNTLATDFENLI